MYNYIVAASLIFGEGKNLQLFDKNIFKYFNLNIVTIRILCSDDFKI